MCPVPLTVRGTGHQWRLKFDVHTGGQNSLYEWEVPGADGLANRERSPLFEYYEGLPPVPPPTPPCKSCTTNLDCDEGEICEGGAGRRKLRFGNIHDGCCRIADEL